MRAVPRVAPLAVFVLALLCALPAGAQGFEATKFPVGGVTFVPPPAIANYANGSANLNPRWDGRKPSRRQRRGITVACGCGRGSQPWSQSSRLLQTTTPKRTKSCM